MIMNESRTQLDNLFYSMSQKNKVGNARLAPPLFPTRLSLDTTSSQRTPSIRGENFESRRSRIALWAMLSYDEVAEVCGGYERDTLAPRFPTGYGWLSTVLSRMPNLHGPNEVSTAQMRLWKYYS